uniref:Methylmalonyl-CoA mutase C-terminal domain-containing protein n=1 Tax=Candidatus Kentrum sp. TC TaxID=2126339 RepID=A0A450Z549_9GAMM|nr:MAG: methylmalonyl-CoA mutase C-terminal domain-containing protein [Candidatus Kentron sp. TC]
MNNRLVEFKNALLSSEHPKVLSILQEEIGVMEPLQCIETIVLPVLEEIGEEWEKGDIALSQLYMCGGICEEAIDKILPAAAPKRATQPRIAIAVLLDHHSLGKRIVYSILRSSGFEIMDFGAGLTVREIAERAVREKIELLLISTLMLNSALMVKGLRDELDRRETRTKIIVGGAPFRFDPNLWKEVGADAVAMQASESVAVIEKMMGEIA